MTSTGTLQLWIYTFLLLWILSSCKLDIPNRSATRVITVTDSSLNLSNRSLCNNATGPREVTFQRLTIHNNALYIGATNHILQIALPDFTLDEVAELGPFEDNPECVAPYMCEKANCPVFRCVDNVNRLLIPHRDQLIACGTAFLGTCDLLTLGNITKPFSPSPSPTDILKCSDALTSQIAQVGGERTIASVYLSNESSSKDLFYFGSGASRPHSVDILFPPRTTPDGSLLKFTAISRSQYFDVTDEKTFILSWTTDEHAFMLWVTPDYTKLVRFCHTSSNDDPDIVGGPNKLYAAASHTETTVHCGSLRVATLAYQVDQVLYVYMKGAQGEPDRLCSANFTTINGHFRAIRKDCLSGTTAISEPDSNEPCEINAKNEYYASCGLPTGAIFVAKAIRSLDAFKLNLAPRFDWSDELLKVTTFAVDRFRDSEVVFFGTANGKIMKVDIAQSEKSFIESITLKEGSPLLIDVGFDKSSSHFYGMTESAVYQVKVASCEQYTGCGECISSEDPYCGWCVLQNKCTTKEACRDAVINNRWMDVTLNPEECPHVAGVQPNKLSINSPQQLSLSFGGNMVPNVSYVCDFTVNGTSIGNSPLTNFPSDPVCQSPTNIPAVRDGQDHLGVSLEIKANDSVVARGAFSIYDCAMTPSTDKSQMCGSCISSQWGCEWCSLSNSCSKNCTDEVGLDDTVECPSVTKITDSNVDIPVGKPHIFTLSTQNLPELNYECVLSICESSSKVRVPADRNQDSISCSVGGENLYCGKEDSKISISLQSGYYIVDSTNLTDVQVGLFNCTGSIPECGICIISHQRHPECSWCVNENICIPDEDCQGEGSTNITFCPTADIEKVFPLNGPNDGGTEITIQGTNLATKTSEITALFLRDSDMDQVNCTVLPEKYIPSRRIVCKTQSTSKRSFRGRVHIRISYTSKEIISKEEFEFKNVAATDYGPRFALKGTNLEIVGDNLDVGNSARIQLISGQSEFVEVCSPRLARRLTCPTPVVSEPGNYELRTIVDGYIKRMDGHLGFVEMPTIKGLRGRDNFISFNKGGIEVEFELTSLRGIQSVILSVNDGQKEQRCELFSNSSSVTCPVPPLNDDPSPEQSRRKRSDGIQASLNRNPVPSKLVINGATEIRLSEKNQLYYVADPTIDDLQLIPCRSSDSSSEGTTFNTNISLPEEPEEEPMIMVQLTGKHLAEGAVVNDYSVLISDAKDVKTAFTKCNLTFLNNEILICKSSVSEMKKYEKRKVKLTVQVGNLTRVLSPDYCPGGDRSNGFTPGVIAAIVAVVVFLILVIIILICVQRQRAKKQLKERKQIMGLIDKLENKTRETARKAYCELQLGYMTTLTDNISDSITYIPPVSCFMKALFNDWKTDHPMLATKEIENVSNIKLSGVDEFAVLLKDKDFLILLVRTLEEQKHFTVKEKGHFASLLTVCLFDDMVYFTKSESVVEKMVSHWLCITLYSECIREQAGKPLFLMTKAIHYLVNSAPCDVVANKAVNSLNEMTLLGTEVTYDVMTLKASVSTGEKRSEFFEVKVVNCDTITQVKEKVIEVYYRDRPYSECPKPDRMQLELLVGGQGNLVLSDVDHMSHAEGSYTKINTLQHYNVPNEAEVILSPVSEESIQQDECESPCESVFSGGFEQFLDRNYSFNLYIQEQEAAEAGSPPPEPKKKRLYHLIHPRDKQANGPVEDEEGSHKATSLIGNLLNQPFQEIFLTRMVKSKTTVQDYVDKVFKAILNPTPISRCVKFLFQYLDKEASKHKINDNEVLHIWKNNSLLLRYWVNILKNPEFLFDVNKTAIVDSCLNVITQAFMDACTTTSHKLGQDSPSNKLLYAKDSKVYKEMVEKFFVNVSNEEPVCEDEITGILRDVSKKYANDFNKRAAALELFSYVEKYRTQVLEAVENDTLYSRLNETIRKISPDTNGHQAAYQTSILV